jgi:hypothetical protein
MDNREPWWALLVTWRFWGPVLGVIMLLAGIIAALLFLLRGDTAGMLWVILLWIVAFLLAVIVSQLLRRWS